MKQRIWIVILILLYFHSFLISSKKKRMKSLKVNNYPFYIYYDGAHPLNHYSSSGWMGDCSDLSLNDQYRKTRFSGKNCIKIAYSAKRSQTHGWAGIYWQNPTFNWGYLKYYPSGYDLKKAKKLFFYAKGSKGNEFIGVKMGGIKGDAPDSTEGNKMAFLKLKKYWKLYEIDLKGLDLSYIIGGYCIVFDYQNNPDGCTVYLDDLYYYDKDVPHSVIQKFNTIQSTNLSRRENKITIAVLDFKNRTKVWDLDYLSKTISEEISRYFLKKKDIWIIDINKVNYYIKVITKNISGYKLSPELFTKEVLNVDYIVQGEFKGRKDIITINASITCNNKKKKVIKKTVQGKVDKSIFLIFEDLARSLEKYIEK